MALIFIGIGSSINKKENIRLGIQALQAEFGQLQISPIYESEAIGFNGCNFYNLVVSINTQLEAHTIICKLKAIEVQQGRPEKAVKYAPRTLDLDLLLHGQLINSEIDIPRAEILKNAFVLQPLSELAPQMTHPILKETYQSLWEKFPNKKQKLWKIDPITQQKIN